MWGEEGGGGGSVCVMGDGVCDGGGVMGQCVCDGGVV